MSIIYEALKKTQDRFSLTSEKNGREIFKLKLYIVFIIIALLGCSYALTTLLYTPSYPEADFKKDIKTTTAEEQKPAIADTKLKASQEKSERFVLSGIVSTNNEKIALINDEMVKKGDCIEGACVINVLDDKVYLDLGGKSIVLKIK